MLVYLLGEPHAGIIRLPDVPPIERIRLMADLRARHASDLAGAMITIRADRIRISRPPP
jgi:hypothetical protein